MSAPLTIQAALVIAKDRAHARLGEAQSKILRVADSCVGSTCIRFVRNPMVKRLLPEMDDVSQECRMVIVGKVVQAFDPSRLEGHDEATAEKMFCGYAIQALRSHFLDVLRVQGRRPGLVSGLKSAWQGSRNRDGRSVEGDFKGLIDDEIDRSHPENHAGGLDEREVMVALRRTLKGDDFDIAYLAYEGYNPREIAAVVKLTPKTVRVRLRESIAPLVEESLGRLGYAVPAETHSVV